MITRDKRYNIILLGCGYKYIVPSRCPEFEQHDLPVRKIHGLADLFSFRRCFRGHLAILSDGPRRVQFPSRSQS